MTSQHYFKKLALTTALVSFSAAASATVLTSIKPLGFIASSIADGVTDTKVLVPAGASPHDYSLKPSDVQKLKNAELVVWVGKDVDSFLSSSILNNFSQDKLVTIANLPEVDEDVLLTGHHHHHHHHHDEGAEEHHHHDHDEGAEEHHHHDQDEADEDHHKHSLNDESINWHIWYSPEISRIVAKDIAHKLMAKYPNKRAKIQQNLSSFNHSLTEKSAQIKKQLKPVGNKGFYVFHDAYTYFNKAYGLKQLGYFTVNPLVSPGVKTLAKIKEEIKEHKVQCLFAEPQFTPKVIQTLSKATGVKVGKLDPMGGSVSLGKNSYANFLQTMANSYLECLK